MPLFSGIDLKGWIQNLGIEIMTSREIPRHIAIILDGNRRYAKKMKINKQVGHSKGSDKVEVIAEIARKLGVKELTLYGFSIENFKRDSEEISYLMDLFRRNFTKLLYEESYTERIKKHGIRVKVIGDLSKLPDDLCKLIAKVMYMTKDNSSLILTLALSYTSRNEITEAVRSVTRAVEENRLKLEDISQNLLDKCMYTEDSIPVDLLIRTSGETRLSDFMLWQGSTAFIYFTPLDWPEFSAWEVFKAILQYQRNFETLRRVRKMENEKLIENERVKKFLQELYQERLDGHFKAIE